MIPLSHLCQALPSCPENASDWGETEGPCSGVGTDEVLGPEVGTDEVLGPEVGTDEVLGPEVGADEVLGPGVGADDVLAWFTTGMRLGSAFE